jgi:putative transposase
VQHPTPPRGRGGPHSTTGDRGDLATIYCTDARFKLQRTGFRGVVARRWVVQRTFSWLALSRRLSKDDERLCQTSETGIDIVMSHLTLRRLTAP